MWDVYGLDGNPFEIKAVELGGLVPVSTFLGRTTDRQNLGQAIKSHNHSLNLVVGDRGVGKTSLGNVVRSDLFETHFTTLNEIDTQHDWSSIDFIEHALLSLFETTYQAKTHTGLSIAYLRTCDEIQKIIKPFFISEEKSLGGQAVSIGFQYGYGKSVTKAPHQLLRLTFKQIAQCIVANGYAGLILQYNNLDNMEIDPKKLSRLFADLRDFLITEKTHFIILGNKLMEAGVKYEPKVNECITSSHYLGSFSSKIIQQIVEKRYDVFKLKDRIPTPPVTPEAVDLLCDLFDGNIRQVFFSLSSAVIGYGVPQGRIGSLNKDDVRRVLNRLAQQKIQKDVDQRALEVLRLIIYKNSDITNTEITKGLHLLSSNTSKYLRQLKENNLAIQSDRIGRKIFYRAVHEARWLLLDPDKGIQMDIARYSADE